MKKKDKILLIRIIISFALLGATLFVKQELLKYIFLGISYFSVGYSVIKKAVQRIFKGKFFDENFLMMIATVGAVCVGEYYEAAAVMLFYQIGELFQSYAVGKSRKSITDLMNICPTYANLEKDGNMEIVDPYEVCVGDIILIKPGEKVPLDGVIISGTTSLNTAPLTGESIPRDAVVGDKINSGAVNLTGLIRVKVTTEFSDSTVSKILELVENSSANKAKSESFITRFSYYYTPAVVMLAVCLAFIPPIFLGGFANWVHRALIFLVVSCPCALVISVPLSFFGGIGGASRNGILIKGSNYIESLANCKTVIFDKTGTLTKGEFEVVSVNPCKVTGEELGKIAGIAEKGSNHPVAMAIAKKFPTQENASEINEIAGKGVSAVYKDKVILAGNERLMADNNVDIVKPDTTGVIVYVAMDSKFIGSVVIADTLKEDSKNAVAMLYSTGIKKTVMLTGDTEENALPVARELNISEFKSGLLPADKVLETEKIIARENGNVAFVGDGINDAPVLALSDVGIAMGGIGSDAAIEAADVVLMDDKPSKIALAVQISKKTMRIVKENIAFAIGVKGIILILGALGFANMWTAVFADVGVAFIAILNAMRTLKQCRG